MPSRAKDTALFAACSTTSMDMIVRGTRRGSRSNRGPMGASGTTMDMFVLFFLFSIVFFKNLDGWFAAVPSSHDSHKLFG